jgi:ubiquitin carboxyl-terminal hydrolase 8
MQPRQTQTENNGLSGLKNLGNTCYMNTCLQALSNTQELTDFLKTEIYKTKLNPICDSMLLVEWDILRILMSKNRKNEVITPDRFVNTFQKIAKIKGQTLFTGFSQNDLPEFLVFIIDCFHNAISRKVCMNIVGESLNSADDLARKCFETIKRMYSHEYSEIWNLFYGIHVSNLTTTDTNECISQTPEPFFMIDLPIPTKLKAPTLLDCFNAYVDGELLTDVLNETRNKRETVQKQIQFWSFPTVLIIDLKRFTSNNQKDQRLVSFPVECLDLSSFVIGYRPEIYKYELYAVCNHIGNVLGGHYTAFIKNVNEKWYHMNDSAISEIQEPAIITPMAYCLFYRRKKIE